MAVYPTKTHKINNKNKKFKAGLTLTIVFSLILILLAFNLLDIFTILMNGTFGLLIYPMSVFFIILGILLMCNRSIKTTNAIIVFSIVWLCIFTLILQMATSKNIDAGFAKYITTTFKETLTAGGVIFATLLYPIYYLTYSVATYIILAIAEVIITAILIDKIYIEHQNAKVNIKPSKKEEINEVIEEDEEEFDDEVESIAYSAETKSNADEDIFIADEEENDQKEKAKNILKLYNDSKVNDTSIDTSDYTEKLEKQIINQNSNVVEEQTSKKPNIFVHEDTFAASPTINSTSINSVESAAEKEKQRLDEERRKSALAYLNISNGKFDTKTKEVGIDNVKPANQVWQEESKEVELNKQTQNNTQRLNNLSDMFNKLQNSQKEMSVGVNPFKNTQQNTTTFEQTKIDLNSNQPRDIYDGNFTKKDFMNSRDNGNLSNNFPELAKKVYSGETNNNIVESTSYRPVQESMLEPIKKNKPTSKPYKKPPTYNRPPIDLLKKYSTNIETDNAYIQEKGQLIVDTLKAFRIETKIINAIKGPTFTRYELQMAPGISVNTVNNKINDLSMALESTCRVQVPIPGKNAFGIEVPNKKRVTVGLREIIESQNFQSSKSPLTFALGKDISGDCKVSSIDELVHTLVAGSTGSGKSVCLNTMLISLLYKASPEDLRLILVDPKTVEFSLFNNLPHMLIPNTVTECEKAVDALNWLVEEMERRYKKLNALGVKKISEYNETAEVISGSIPKMYYIVMVFDEVGDFMTRAKKEIEEKIMLLAAKSRACGIHLVLATQRPTVDVITGTIKANLPSRIAFAVNSYNDSKTILESSGAEYLLGYGDMLFIPKGSNDLSRIQGCFLDNNELKNIINYIKDNNEAEFDEEVADQMFNKKEGFDAGNGAEDAFDPLMKDCLRYFIKAKKASASSLQAYFGIGYPKANKIVLQMERAGFVSPGDNNGRRTLYITQQEFEERFGEDLDE